MKELVCYHHTAMNGGGIVFSLYESLGELDEYLRRFNSDVEAEYKREMAGVEAISLENPESTKRAKVHYGSIARRKKEHGTLRNGGELIEGQQYKYVNLIFSSDDHALTMVHGCAVKRDEYFARTADGTLSDELHSD